jgi:transaldolase/glucose-6-phosphate isomerase
MTITVSTPTQALAALGQSLWLDTIGRRLLTSGVLQRVIENDALTGVTSNPAIFEKAIASGDDYADIVDAPEMRGTTPQDVYERIATRDVREAADLLRPVYDRTGGRDGYVSLEVSPHLAHDADGTVREARRLWATVGRPNLMIKVPATNAGLAALRQLIEDGLNVNVTLLFAREMYAAAADAYLAGLEARAARRQDISRVASVASFFISRIDAAVEERLTSEEARTALRGRVAVANAALAYEHYRRVASSGRWARLAALGAQTQRLLWASTGSKDARMRDVVYIEELIAPDTVNTVPPATLDAFRDHGQPRPSLAAHAATARATLRELAEAGVDLNAITTQLLDDGLSLFVSAFDRMLAATALRIGSPRAESRGSARRSPVNTIALSLSPDLTALVDAALHTWQTSHGSERLWNRDPSLWTGTDEHKWLGWLPAAGDQLAQVDDLTRFAAETTRAGVRHVLLLGMGGSSLAPDVLRRTFGHITGFPELHVLDSTDPAQVADIERHVDLTRTLCIVSSKSGSTLEPNIFLRYFFARVAAAVGEDQAGARFIAVTDPGSNLEAEAGQLGFARVFFGVPSIGGRYSALSSFGMVPAALMGLDVERFLRTTEQMVGACGPSVGAAANPGVMLGTVLGVLGGHGRDKVTFVASPGIGSLGAWLEQLIAESTGKSGLGLIPIDGETPAPAALYGQDRVFAYLRLATAPDAAQDQAVDALERAGHPVIRIGVHEPYAIGQEFFRWEIATAVAGAHIRINPFDQPDVEASKIATRALTDEYERAGTLPEESPFFTAEGVRLYADERNAEALRAAAGTQPTLERLLRAHLRRIGEGDYFALLAYIEMNAANEAPIQRIRHAVRDARGTATCVGFGPRFLHSTGQAYKGGPNTGVFLQVTCDDAADLAVPGRRFTFGVVKAAQARGDFQVLAERQRRALRVHLGSDVATGLATLQAAITRALAS